MGRHLRDLQSAMRSVLADPSLCGPDLERALAALAPLDPATVLRVAMRDAARQDLSVIDARLLFERIEAHRRRLAVTLARDPGFLVAAADHLGAGAGADGGNDRETRRAARYDRAIACVALSPDGGEGEIWMHRAIPALTGTARDTDVVRREGGAVEVLLPGATDMTARGAAERLRLAARGVSGRPWSGGVAATPRADGGRGGGPEAGARAALRAARAAGGDRVVLHRHERRGFARRAVRGAIAAGFAGAPGGAAGALADLSVGGALLISPLRLRSGARFALTLLETSPRPRRARLSASVRRCDPGPGRPDGRARWRAAVEFVGGIDERMNVAWLLAGLAGGGA